MGLKTILEQVLPRYRNSAILKYPHSVYITYKHNEKLFKVNLSRKEKDDTGQHKISEQESQIECQVPRDLFIKNIISSNLRPHPLEPKKVVIDFSSPNIAKPFHVGHLRSTIIGNFISNINNYYNNHVVKINYLGDWGTQFGLLQYGLQAKNIELEKLKENPIKILYETYVYANKLAAFDENVQNTARKYFSDIEKGHASLDNWKSIRDITIHELENVYQRLGIKFDYYHWESDYNGNTIKDILNSLESAGILHTDETGKKVTKVNDRTVSVMKSDNTTLYLSRDIAALLDRHQKYNFDKMLYIVDNSQTDHFTVLFDIVKRVNKKCAVGCEHIKFGRIKGMSTRSGNVVFLKDILDEAKRKMYEKQKASKNTRHSAMNEETCDVLGTTAVILNDLKQRRLKDYTFDWDRALQSEGDSGIKLQYLHCRLWSLENNTGVAIPNICDPSYLQEEIIGELVGEIGKFQNVLYRSLHENEACILVNYLFRLAKYVNKMFSELRVKNVDSDLASQRMLVFHSARMVVKTGLEILGVKPLNEM